MAALLFLKMLDDGGKVVSGESEVPDHEGDIELEAYSWDMAQRSEKQGKVGGVVNYARPKKFKFTKWPDASTTRMLQLHKEEAECTQAVFHLYEVLAGTKEATGGEFNLKITLNKVLITNYSLNCTSTDKSVDMKEEWELDYTSIEFDHKDQGARLLIQKPREEDKADEMTTKGGSASDTSAGAGAASPGGRAEPGSQDFLPPLGSF